MNKCFNCQTLTQNPKFCCRSCSVSFTNKLNPKRKRTSFCKKCNAPVIYNRKHCDSCKKTNEDLFKKHLTLKDLQEYAIVTKCHPSWTNSIIRQRCRKLYKNAFTKCKACGYSLHIEMCHIKPISSFPPETPIGVINDKNNVIALCRNCHWEFDNNHLSLVFPEFEEIHN